VGVVMIFSDCRIAVQLCQSNALPGSHVDLIVGIRLQLQQLRSIASIYLSWIASHCGIQGNEIADQAFKVATTNVAGFDHCPIWPPSLHHMFWLGQPFSIPGKWHGRGLCPLTPV
jgi:hypothetical protein